MLDTLAPGHTVKAGTHRYSVHYAGKHAFLGKGPGASTEKRSERSGVQIRMKEAVGLVSQLGICFKCAQEWFPDLKLPGDKEGDEVRSYCQVKAIASATSTAEAR